MTIPRCDPDAVVCLAFVPQDVPKVQQRHNLEEIQKAAAILTDQGWSEFKAMRLDPSEVQAILRKVFTDTGGV